MAHLKLIIHSSLLLEGRYGSDTSIKYKVFKFSRLLRYSSLKHLNICIYLGIIMTEKEVTKLKDNGEKELEMERDVQK